MCFNLKPISDILSRVDSQWVLPLLPSALFLRLSTYTLLPPAFRFHWIHSFYRRHETCLLQSFPWWVLPEKSLVKLGLLRDKCIFLYNGVGAVILLLDVHASWVLGTLFSIDNLDVQSLARKFVDTVRNETTKFYSLGVQQGSYVVAQMLWTSFFSLDCRIVLTYLVTNYVWVSIKEGNLSK